MSKYVIVLAGGSGQRMGRDENKVFLPLGGVPAIVRAVVPFSALCDGAVVVARERERQDMEDLLRGYGLSRMVCAVVCGGEDRQASVAAGLSALPEDVGIVLIHDGARALVTEDVIRRVMASAECRGTGVAAMPVTDTIKRARMGGQVDETLPRDGLYAIQTPQGFLLEQLKKAHQYADETGYRGTDDASLLEHAGLPVYLCRGDAENIKLTTPEDVALAGMILTRREERKSSVQEAFAPD